MTLSRKLAPFACLALIACAQPSAGGATGPAAASIPSSATVPGRPAPDPASAGGRSSQGIELLARIPLKLYGVRQTYGSCVAAKTRIQDQEECSFEEGQFQDARLNRSYGALRTALKRASPDVEQALVKAERAWLVFRDANCDAKAQRFGSDAAPAVLSECHMLSTAMRAQELDDWLATVTSR